MSFLLDLIKQIKSSVVTYYAFVVNYQTGAASVATDDRALEILKQKLLSVALRYGFARIKASATIDADTSDELCCGSIPHSLCVWLNPNYAVKVKSLEKLLGDSEFQLSSYIASTKKSTRDSEHRLQHPVASAEASYGIRSIHVDGNDALAVFTAVQEARKIAVNEHKTVLVESRVQTKQNAGADKRQQYKGVVGSGFNSDRQPYQFLVLVKLLP
ncbi:hypothetical protein FXO37_15701 [Capsicum annuum]|nr:hypothetical protein FXO37_15701 [Capsicum annuum]